MKVGFAGAGNMAAAMARGWAAADEGGPDGMLFCDLDRDRAEAISGEVGGETRDGLRELARDSDALVLAVKPTGLEQAAQELGGEAPPLISVLAATPTSRLAAAFPGVPRMRVMPNQPVQVQRGVVCYVKPEEMSADLESQLLALLGGLGTLVELPEHLVDAAMAIMSCTPAYFAAIARALADAGSNEGLDGELARQLVAATLRGTGELLAVRTPEEVEQAVAPPGGATEAGLRALERGGVATAMGDAVQASLERFR
jgi:pyrroline-5-carboxylate reductase